jgi:hypothetical protein
MIQRSHRTTIRTMVRVPCIIPAYAGLAEEYCGPEVVRDESDHVLFDINAFGFGCWSSKGY